MGTVTTAPQNAMKRERIASIDRYRGAVIFSMIFFQLLAHFENLGKWATIASHDPAKGIVLFPWLPAEYTLCLADVVAPMFMFAIALTYKHSFDSRVKRMGEKTAVKHFLFRYTALIGIGSLLSAVNVVLDSDIDDFADYIFIALIGVFVLSAVLMLIARISRKKGFLGAMKKLMAATVLIMGVLTIILCTYDFIALMAGKPDFGSVKRYGYWLVLQSIGGAGLITLIFIKYGTLTRLIAGIGLLASYAVVHETGNQELLDVVPQGGIFSSLSWGALIVLGTVFADWYYSNKRRFLVGLAVAAVPTVIIASGIIYDAAGSLLLGIRKGSASPGYMIVSLCVSVAVFAVFDLFNFYKLKFDPLAWWGKNPILMYLLEFGLVGGYAVLAEALGWLDISVAVSVTQAAALTASLTLIAFILDKKKIIIKL